jgi:hypothetical protein
MPAPHLSWRHAELTPERVGEVAVRGEAECDADGSDLVTRFQQAIERLAKSDRPHQSVHRHPGLGGDATSQMEW